MIEVHKTDNILEDKFFNFSYSKQFLTENEIINIGNIQAVSFYIKGKNSSREADFVLKELIKLLLVNYKIYFVLSENYLGKRSKVRTHKKLFYQKKNDIGEKNLFEEETAIEKNSTILSGIVKITQNNLDYCVKNLITSLFRFGYIVQKEKRSFVKNKAGFLNEIIKEKAQIDKRIKLNILKVISTYARGDSFILRLFNDGQDHISIEIFGQKNNLDKLTLNIKLELEKKFYIKDFEKTAAFKPIFNDLK